ncbi:APC family permease [Nocardioides sp. LS1]|uniref:APC family permease n=1 Tax=Nocardioides sp. LS1 TaxID=1027620 RepID=UPI000F625175|nr:APC family permease [Nocardioides sp. LS1]GCD91197.1 amino acid permease [Nocardioides sp. LS1]
MVDADQNNSDTTQRSLRAGSLGVVGIAFFVIASIGPMSAVVGGVPLAFAVGPGAGVPALFVLTGLLLLLFAVGFVTMSHRIVSAGGFYEYVGAAFGVRAKRAAGYLALLSYYAVVIALWALLAVTLSGFVVEFGGPEVSWVYYMLAGLLIVGFLGYRDVNVSARVLGVLTIAEVVIILVLNAAVIFQGGAEGLSATPFEPSRALDGNVGAGLLFCVAVFLGFEGTAIYSEEARDPKRTIPIATYVCVGLISAFYILTTWTLVMAFGIDNVQGAAQQDPAGFVFSAGAQYIGNSFVDAMKVLFVTSTFAACLGMHNAIARYQFSLARERMLPEALSETHPVWKSPTKSSVVQTIIGLGVTVLAWATGQDPIHIVFALLLAVGTLGVIVIWVFTSAAIVKYFQVEEHDEHVFKTLIAPAISGVGLAWVVVLLIKNWDLQTGMPDSWASYLPLTIVAVLALGFLLPVPAGASVRTRPMSDASDSTREPV